MSKFVLDLLFLSKALHIKLKKPELLSSGFYKN
jgi:hypothetical protein